MSTDSLTVLTRSDIYDLYALDREVRKSCGVGILPPVVNRVFEKIVFVGEDSVKPEEVEAAFAEFQRAHTENVFSSPLTIKERTETTS